MKYLFILIALGLIVSPLLALQPSQREKQVRRLRERATARGLHVKFADSDKPAQDGRATRYLLPVAPNSGLERLLAMPLIFEKTVPDNGDSAAWQTRSRIPETLSEENLSTLLKSLPEDVFEVSLASRRLSVLWRERGEIEQVDAIADTLESLCRALRKRADCVSACGASLPDA